MYGSTALPATATGAVRRAAALCALALLTVSGSPTANAAAPAARAAVTAAELVVEPPTLMALGFEWYVDGDDNGNATVAVSYRRKGSTAWRDALPLVRLDRDDHAGQYGPPVPPAERPNLLAGSVFDLDADTDYEVRLVLSDADGVRGRRERLLVAHTRAEPKPAPGGRVFHVYPPDYRGTVQQPAFIGLLAAYYDGNNIAADHYNVYPPRVHAGDTIMVHAGVYKDNWHFYAQGSSALPPSGQWPANPTCCGGTFHGTNFLIASGTADKPIVIKGAGDGEAIFDGDGNWTLFNVMGGGYHYFEGLTFRNTQVAIEAGQKGVGGSVGLVVKHCRFENIGEGIHTDSGGSRDFYIADNDFQGRDDPKLLVPWSLGLAAGVHGARLKLLPQATVEATRLRSQYAVKVYGSGNVIAYNRARDFHDGFDLATYGVPDGWPHPPRDRMPVANDIYNNDISNMHDDCIEADGAAYNTRVLRNHCVNAAGSGISTQPGFGGPVYIVRNVAYHIPGNFAALKTSGAPGLRVYNNTFIAALRASFGTSTVSDFRNNLVLAEFPEEPAFVMPDTATLTADFNGYHAGAEAPALIQRTLAAPAGQKPPPPKSFSTLSEAAAGLGGSDVHSRTVDYDVFANLKPADTVEITRVYDPASIDFGLRAGGAAIDAGTPLPNVTDGFAGRAPDLGAHELGAPIPHYGPR